MNVSVIDDETLIDAETEKFDCVSEKEADLALVSECELLMLGLCEMVCVTRDALFCTENEDVRDTVCGPAVAVTVADGWRLRERVGDNDLVGFSLRDPDNDGDDETV